MVDIIEVGKWYRVFGNPIWHSLPHGEPVQVIEDLSDDPKFRNNILGRKTYKVRTVFGKEAILFDKFLYKDRT